MSENLIDKLKRLGMVSQDEVKNEPSSSNPNTWDSLLEALAKNPGPKATKLYNSYLKKYTLTRSKHLIKERTNQMAEEIQETGTQNASVEEPTVETPNEETQSQ